MSLPLVTAEQMREIDRHTLASGVPGETLMDRAGAGVVEAMARRYGPLLGMRVIVLCGPGNNGGDGFVAARHLRVHGADVHVGLLAPLERVKGDAKLQLERMRAAGLPINVIENGETLRTMVARHARWDYALDALLGTGARGPLEGVIATAAQVLRELDDTGTRVVAVDLPTGVDADTGEIARRAVRSDLTVTFGAAKRGQLLYPGRAFVGRLEVVDIGLLAPKAGAAHAIVLATQDGMARLVPLRDPRAHKGSVGRVVVLGGAAGYTGAVALAARAATRSGAGYVQAAVPESVVDVLSTKLTEELPVAMPERRPRVLAVEALAPALALAGSAHAALVGPGLSRVPCAEELARRFVAACPVPMVVDADALNAFEGQSEKLAELKAQAVITPHLGEMQRLTGVPAVQLEARRIDAAREWAARWGVVVVLKGAPTVVAAPDGRTCVNPTGNPGMATAGVGDVLAGLLVALLAQGLERFDAACLAAWIHGSAGDRAAADQGQHGMNASDVLERLPVTMLELSRLADRMAEAPKR
jgi:NAD(P)H-hydrate epimerase